MNSPPTEEEILEAISSQLIKPLTLELYSPEKGYILVIPGKNCEDAQTRFFSYNESELIESVDRGEIPWFLADVFEQCPAQLYFRGCIGIRIVDKQLEKTETATSSTENEELRVLRPSSLSLLHDLNGILLLAGGSKLSKKERNRIESQFWATVAPPMALGPDHVYHSTSEIPLDTFGIRKMCLPLKRRRIERERNEVNLLMKESSKMAFSRMISENRTKLVTHRELDWRKSVANWKMSEKPQKAGGGQWKPMMRTKSPEELADRRYTAIKQRAIEPEYLYETQIHRVEEIRVEMPIYVTRNEPASVDGGVVTQQVGSSVTRIIISKHNYDSTYWGQLLLETPSVQSGPFFLGVDADARNYVYQYLDMVTEAGRRQPISVVRTSPPKNPQNLISPTPGPPPPSLPFVNT